MGQVDLDSVYSPSDAAHLSDWISGTTHIWLLDLEKLDAAIPEKYQYLLSPTELARAQTFTQRQGEFIATKIFQRLCLARYTNQPPEAINIATTKAGKPYLTQASLTPGSLTLGSLTKDSLHFNLSHCANLVALAVSNHTLGIDIEVQRKRSTLEIAQRYFHPREIAQLEAATAENRNALFFKLWTLKEAFFKALGGGIATGLDKVNFEFEQDNIHFLFAPELGQRETDWQFSQQMLNHNIHLALASCQPTPHSLHWFDGIDLFHF